MQQLRVFRFYDGARSSEDNLILLALRVFTGADRRPISDLDCQITILRLLRRQLVTHLREIAVSSQVNDIISCEASRATRLVDLLSPRGSRGIILDEDTT